MSSKKSLLAVAENSGGQCRGLSIGLRGQADLLEPTDPHLAKILRGLAEALAGIADDLTLAATRGSRTRMLKVLGVGLTIVTSLFRGGLEEIGGTVADSLFGDSVEAQAADLRDGLGEAIEWLKSDEGAAPTRGFADGNAVAAPGRGPDPIVVPVEPGILRFEGVTPVASSGRGDATARPETIPLRAEVLPATANGGGSTGTGAVGQEPQTARGGGDMRYTEGTVDLNLGTAPPVTLEPRDLVVETAIDTVTLTPGDGGRDVGGRAAGQVTTSGTVTSGSGPGEAVTGSADVTEAPDVVGPPDGADD